MQKYIFTADYRDFPKGVVVIAEAFQRGQETVDSLIQSGTLAIYEENLEVSTPEAVAGQNVQDEEKVNLTSPTPKIYAGKEVRGYDGGSALLETGERVPLTQEQYDKLPYGG